jgi:hypothetical protein
MSYCAALEWTENKRTDSQAQHLARIFETAPLVYIFYGDCPVFTYEVLAECRRVKPEIILPELPLLPLAGKKDAWDVLLEIPGYLTKEEIEINKATGDPDPATSFSEVVSQTHSYTVKFPDRCRKRSEGFAEAWARAPESPETWMNSFLRIDKIIEAYNPNYTNEDVSKVLGQVDIKRCPAILLNNAARALARKRYETPRTENEVDDWMFVPVVPYADLVLADNALADWLWRADPTLKNKVFSDPCKAVQRLKEGWCDV